MAIVIFDGVAYGMLLFLIAVGLSITMGLMNFVNLAHGSFAMVGGYAAALLMNRYGLGFYPALAAAFVAAALVGALFEALLYRRLYKAHPLDQVLLSIGIVFVSVAAFTWFFGPTMQPFTLPESLDGRLSLLGLEVSRYRLFLIVCGLAGLGGALSLGMLGLEPSFPLKYLVYFLIVVCVGGAGTITGPFVAALMVGIVDVAGKYYLPEAGAFLIYVVMIVMLLVRPNGIVPRKGLA